MVIDQQRKEEIQTLTQKYSEAKNEIEELKQKLKKMEEEKNDAVERQEHAEKILLAKDSSERLKDKILTEKIQAEEKLKEEIGKLERSSMEKSQQVDKQVDELKRKLEEQQKDFSAKIQAQEAQKADILKQLKAIETDFKQTVNDRQGLEQQLATKMQSVKELQEKIDRINSESMLVSQRSEDQLRAAIIQHNLEMEQLKKKLKQKEDQEQLFEKRTIEFTLNLDEKDKLVRNLQQDLDSLRTFVTETSLERDKLQHDTKLLASKLEESKDKFQDVTSLQQDLRRVKDRNTALEEQLKESKKSISDLSHRINENSLILQHREQVITDLQNKKRILEAEYKQFKDDSLKKEEKLEKGSFLLTTGDLTQLEKIETEKKLERQMFNVRCFVVCSIFLTCCSLPKMWKKIERYLMKTKTWYEVLQIFLTF